MHRKRFLTNNDAQALAAAQASRQEQQRLGSTKEQEAQKAAEQKLDQHLMNVGQIMMHSCGGDAFYMQLGSVGDRMRTRQLKEVLAAEGLATDDKALQGLEASVRGRVKSIVSNQHSSFFENMQRQIVAEQAEDNSREVQAIKVEEVLAEPRPEDTLPPPLVERLSQSDAKLAEWRAELARKYPLPSETRAAADTEREVQAQALIAQARERRQAVQEAAGVVRLPQIAGATKSGAEKTEAERQEMQAFLLTLKTVKKNRAKRGAQALLEFAKQQAENRLSARVQMEGLMKGWEQAAAGQSRNHRLREANWKEMMHAGAVAGLQLREQAGTKGSRIYQLRCLDQGVRPSTLVMMQLQKPFCNLAHCKLGSKGLEALRKALFFTSSMTALDLTDNVLGPAAVEALVKGLALGVAALEAAVKAEGNLRTVETANMGAKARTLRRNAGEAVEEEDDGGWKPDAASQALLGRGSMQAQRDEERAAAQRAELAKALISAKQYNTKIQQLDLSQNIVGLQGVTALSRLLDPAEMNYHYLKVLMLNECAIPDAGGKELIQALSSTQARIIRLELRNNKLGDKTCEQLGVVLAVNRSLTDLDVSWNHICAEGAIAMAAGLAGNRYMQHLNLAWNGLMDEGVMAFAQALAQNKHLLTMDMSQTRFTGKSCVLLGDALRHNRTLQTLLLDGNSIGAAGAAHILAGLKTNATLGKLGLQGANMTDAASGSDGANASAAARFNPLAPDGTYALDLANASERAIAIQLWHLDKATPTDGILKCTLNGVAVDNPTAQDWTRLPTTGSLAFTFRSPLGMATELKTMAPNQYETMRSQLQGVGISEKDMLQLIKVLAPFNYLSFEQIAGFVKPFGAGEEGLEAALVLYCRQLDHPANMQTFLDALGKTSVPVFWKTMGWHASVRFNNFIGHYELNMGEPFHQHLTNRLKDVAMELPAGTVLWNNIRYTDVKGQLSLDRSLGPPEAWAGRIPAHGYLSFDCVITQPAPGWHAASVEEVMALLVEDLKVATAVPPPTKEELEAAEAAAAEAKAKAAIPKLGAVVDAATHRRVGFSRGPSTPGGPHTEPSGAMQEAAHWPELHHIVPNPSKDWDQAQAQVVRLRQLLSERQLRLGCDQLRKVLACFAFAPHRVEAVVVAFATMLDREEDLWRVMYDLKCLEQVCATRRLGVNAVFNPDHPSMHWLLDLRDPQNEMVFKRMVQAAVQTTDIDWFYNMRNKGDRVYWKEDSNMWGFISAQLALSHPVMEFDFAGPDFWILGGGTSKEEYELVPIGKRNDTVKTWAAQAETARTKFLHGYAGDSSGWKAPQWASLDGMLSPQVDKAPWLAAWHGLMRAMIASENICGDMSGQESRLSMLFHSYARQEERTMPRLRFEQLMRETGHGRLLVAEYVKKFQEAVDRKVAAAVKKALAAREKLEAAAAAAAAKAEGGASQGEGGGARGGRRQGSIKAQGSMKALASIKGEQSLSSLPSRKQVAGLPPPAPSAERSMREIASMSKEASVRASMRGLAAEASAPAVLGNAAAPPAPQAEPSKLSPLELLGKAGLQQAEELNYSEFVDVFMLQLNPPKPRMAVAFPWMSLGAATSKFAAAEAELNDLLSAGAAN